MVAWDMVLPSPSGIGAFSSAMMSEPLAVSRAGRALGAQSTSGGAQEGGNAQQTSYHEVSEIDHDRVSIHWEPTNSSWCF
jgi:hypothetical protein